MKLKIQHFTLKYVIHVLAFPQKEVNRIVGGGGVGSLGGLKPTSGTVLITRTCPLPRNLINERTRISSLCKEQRTSRNRDHNARIKSINW